MAMAQPTFLGGEQRRVVFVPSDLRLWVAIFDLTRPNLQKEGRRREWREPTRASTHQMLAHLRWALLVD